MTAKVERLVNLTVALLHTRRPLPLSEIRDKVAGYDQKDPESARRMFERDKSDLRALGVPVETRPLDAFEVEWGYTIDGDRYALPPIDLSADEVTALAVALEVTGHEHVGLGFAKLVARAPDPDEGAVPPTQIDLGLGPLDGLDTALAHRQPVRFDYRTAAGVAGTRTVDPYGLILRGGAWYLVGRDHGRDALRVYRLDRMGTAPRLVDQPDAFAVPDDLDLVAAVSGPSARTTRVEVAVDPGILWEATRRGGTVTGERQGSWPVVRFEADPDRLLPWLLGCGAQAEVTAPARLRIRIIDRLRTVAEDHGRRPPCRDLPCSHDRSAGGTEPGEQGRGP